MTRQGKPNSKPRLCLAISINENVQIGLLEVSFDASKRSMGIKEFPLTGHCNLHDVLHKILTEEVTSEVLQEIAVVTVGTPGIVDSTNGELVSISRKRWGQHFSAQTHCVVNFVLLLQDISGRRFQPGIDLFVENDVVCRVRGEALSETHKGHKRIAYVLLADGINVAFSDTAASNLGLLSERAHPEVGHLYPPLHEKDKELPVDSTNCTNHKYCFEGVASEGRILRSWSVNTLADLDPGGLEWEIICYYISHLCLDVILMEAPTRIVLGGDMAHMKGDEVLRANFIKRISSNLAILNADYLPGSRLSGLLCAATRPNAAFEGAMHLAMVKTLEIDRPRLSVVK